MSAPDFAPDKKPPETLLPPPNESGERVFDEPWQAQAFALVVELHAAGVFSWKDWAAALASQLKLAEDASEPSDGSRYYESWLAALEVLTTQADILSAEEIERRQTEWVDAYRRTPHGRPIEL